MSSLFHSHISRTFSFVLEFPPFLWCEPFLIAEASLVKPPVFFRSSPLHFLFRIRRHIRFSLFPLSDPLFPAVRSVSPRPPLPFFSLASLSFFSRFAPFPSARGALPLHSPLKLEAQSNKCSFFPPSPCANRDVLS